MTAVATNEVAAAKDRLESLRREVARIYLGSSRALDVMLVALLAKGHVLLEGVPGIAKTTLVKAFATALGCSARRIQFTPDLLPADITGTYVLSPREGTFTLRAGPIFANVVLGDEINRAPAKTQSALLEAMQDRQVTVDGTSRPLPQPFVVIATQNPVESQGTYPLPEAQLDRFLMKLTAVDPPRDVEIAIVKNHAGGFDPSDLSSLRAVTSPAELAAMQAFAQGVKIDDAVIGYIVDLTRRTREDRAIELGASPRASIALLKAAQVIAASDGRMFVTPDDVKPMVKPVFRHRVMLQPDAQLQGETPDQRIDELIKSAPVPRAAA